MEGMEEIYAAFDDTGHVESACSRYLDDGEGGVVESPHDGMQLVSFNGDWDRVHFMKLAADGETLELDADYEAQVKDEWEAAAEQRRIEAQNAALKQSQVAVALSMYVNGLALNRVDAVSVCSLYDDWSGKGVEYKKDQWLRYDGDLYHVEQSHTSQPDWTPDVAPSLYTRIPMCPDGIRLWEQPTHAENAFDMGETCHYPDADGPVYRSTMDGNTTEPTTVGAMWEAVE